MFSHMHLYIYVGVVVLFVYTGTLVCERRLLVQVSIDLMDVAINCLATLQSDFTETFPLKSSNLKVDIG